MPVLVTGGAGYIGSHAAHALAARGENVIVLDNLVAGSRAFVPRAATFFLGSAEDSELVLHVIKDCGIDAVMHFAGSIIVPESIEHPLDYYRNNTAASLALIRTCVSSHVRHFIFSSTAAVYGTTDMAPVDEALLARPLNPYGWSKLMTEWMLSDASRAHDFSYIALRYFNVAGVASNSGPGQPERQVPHLIKRAAQVALGCAEHLDIYGTDYPTPDGTAVRDYIHICDLVDAHLLALDYLRSGGGSNIFNCGYGTGSSVREVVAALEKATGLPLPVRNAPRRAGDAPFVVANSERLAKILGWKPKLNQLDVMVRSALDWERRVHLEHESQKRQL